MIYDFSFLWIWLLLALIVGLVVGWITNARGPQGRWFFGWFRLALIVFVIGLLVAWLHWLPGRLGFWLETALFFFAAYIVGCLIGGFVKASVATEAEPATAPQPVAPAPDSIRAAVSQPTVAPTPVQPIATPTPQPAPAFSDSVSSPHPTATPTPVPEPVATPVPQPVPVVAAAASAVAGADPSEPAAMGPVEGEEKHGGSRPPGLVGPRGGKADDLKRIKGIGPQNEGRLHALGVWHFAQIAAWTPDNVHWVGSYLAFPGRIDREEWIAQATALAAGAETAFSKRVEAGGVASKHDDGSAGQSNIADLSNIKPRH
ncbi:hypothetical protein [Methylocapsa sp. S129]|uniref:hypothetical protein n=1 Tax=Methylocapsa sp. S129 TaxID=1641869 RepID=UPI0015763FBE|nr:hypothetical protein [Methylocapsa sp. S129]